MVQWSRPLGSSTNRPFWANRGVSLHSVYASAACDVAVADNVNVNGVAVGGPDGFLSSASFSENTHKRYVREQGQQTRKKDTETGDGGRFNERCGAIRCRHPVAYQQGVESQERESDSLKTRIHLALFALVLPLVPTQTRLPLIPTRTRLACRHATMRLSLAWLRIRIGEQNVKTDFLSRVIDMVPL